MTSGAVLRLDKGAGSDLVIGAEALTLNGAGLTGSPNGALRNVSGNNSLAGAITLGSASTIQSDGSQLLTLSGGIDTTGTGYLLTIRGAGNTTVSTAAITGTGGLTKLDAGTLTLTGANTYTGPTNIQGGGTLEVSGSLSGTTSVILTGGTLLLSGSTPVGGASAGINDAAEVSFGGGKLQVAGGFTNGFNETVGALTLSVASTLDFGSSSGPVSLTLISITLPLPVTTAAARS